MARTLTGADETTLEDIFELVGKRTLEDVYAFVKEHVDEGSITFSDPTLRTLNMPAPKGKQHDAFVLIVNEFFRLAKESKIYPELPSYIGRRKLSHVVSEFTQVSVRIAQMKVDQLVAVGWLESKYGNIQNPVALWWRALQNGRPHPGIPG